MNTFAFLKERLRTQSGNRAFWRAQKILTRYGFGQGKFTVALEGFVRLMHEYEVQPTLPVTASVVKRHPGLFRNLQEDGVEFAVHGYRHVDYTLLSIDEVREHLRKAIDIFQQNQIQFSGYRFPFLRHDTERMDLLEEFKYDWDSSQALSWDFTSWNGYKEDSFDSAEWQTYVRILESYGAAEASESSLLPYERGHLLEIPVSMPDDDILIDRLGFKDGDAIASVWMGMIQNTLQRGELLVMQVHPERFFAYRAALRTILDYAQNQTNIWTATIGDIVHWLRDRQCFRWDISLVERKLYRILPRCSQDASCWIYEGSYRKRLPYQKEDVHIYSWEQEFPVRPAVGFHPSVPSKVKSFICSEGWAFHETTSPGECSVYFGPDITIEELDNQSIRDRIADSVNPLLRFGIWPSGYRCALAVTGDIDSVDLLDYWDRFYG